MKREEKSLDLALAAECRPEAKAGCLVEEMTVQAMQKVMRMHATVRTKFVRGCRNMTVILISWCGGYEQEEAKRKKRRKCTGRGRKQSRNGLKKVLSSVVPGRS